MESAFQILDELQRGGASDVLAKQLGADTGATRSALASAVPALIGALARNSQRPGGADALAGALQRDHDGSVLDDLVGSLGGALAGGGGRGKALDGAGILGHLLGPRRGAVEQQIGQRSGLDSRSVGQLLTMGAPLVMGALGRTQRERSLDGRGLEDLLGQERQRAEASVPGGLGPLARILDSDGDGQLGDDLVRVGGGLLRRLFSRRR